MLLNGKPLKYPKAQVLARLVANRTKHIADYNETVTGYDLQRGRLYYTLAGQMSQNLDPNDHAAVTQQYARVYEANRVLVALVQPVSYVDSYDRVIDQLGLTSDDQVDMDDQTFDAYMRDEWSWKKQFAATTTSYTGK